MLDPLTIMERFRGVVPVPVFDIIAELRLGPYFKSLDDNISGYIERQPNSTYNIVINERHPIVRRRFTAAHELAHFIYHRDLLGLGTGDTRAYRAANSPFPNPSIRPRHERQANAFAANLLMPVDAIERLRAEGVDDVEELAGKLGVSEEAMRIRLGGEL